jgi:hypothetical protein
VNRSNSVNVKQGGKGQPGINSMKPSSQGSGMDAGGIYKPYSIGDYRNQKSKENVKMGGLGANIGSEDWEKKNKKKEAM